MGKGKVRADEVQCPQAASPSQLPQWWGPPRPLASPEGLCSQFSVLSAGIVVFEVIVPSRDSSSWWLELRLHPGVPSQVPMRGAVLSKGSWHFFRGGGGLTQAEMGFWLLLTCASCEPGSISCHPLPWDGCTQCGSAGALLPLGCPERAAQQRWIARVYFYRPCCQWGHVTSVELIKRHPEHWCQLLLVISAPGSFPLWHIKRSRRI